MEVAEVRGDVNAGLRYWEPFKNGQRPGNINLGGCFNVEATTNYS